MAVLICDISIYSSSWTRCFFVSSLSSCLPIVSLYPTNNCVLYLICDDNIIEDKLPDLVNVEVFSEVSQTFQSLFCTRSVNWLLRDNPHWVTIWELPK